jgi:hypothetical protein
MSDSHSSSGGTGKMVVLAIFALMVVVYVLNVFRGVHVPEDPAVVHAHTSVVSIDPKELEKVKLERDQALSEIESLREKLRLAEARIEASENKLNTVRNLLKAEAVVHAK